MSIFRIDSDKIVPIRRTTFVQQGLQERADLQSLLKSQIDIISPDTLIVAEEFGEWEDSRRRIDLLGVDKAANLVVIELKRTEDGGHMELQAIRYAAMISNLTFAVVARTYQSFLQKSGIEQDATGNLLKFLDWEEPQEKVFGQEVKIVLASANFSKELTTSVMWLNDFGLDIRCMKMQPYEHDGQIFIDVQTIIPIPEAADYQVRIREKKQKERESRQTPRDFTKYDVTVGGNQFRALNKRKMMHRLVAEVFASGGTPEQVKKALPSNKLVDFEGALDSEEIVELLQKGDPGGVLPRFKRFFCEDDQIFHIQDKSYVLSNQWGQDTAEAAESLARTFPHLNIDFSKSEASQS